MTTKEQERAALEKIRNIVAGIGADSYIGTAFDGCFEIAASNIDNDFACSMKQRAEAAEHNAEQAERKAKNAVALMNALDAKLNTTTAALEREQEWKPYDSGYSVSQADYDALAQSGHEMTDDEAKDWLCDEFGFDRSKVEILRTKDEEQVNRHGVIRATGNKIDRRPYYDATDWQYILFTVTGWRYECYNDTFKPV